MRRADESNVVALLLPVLDKSNASAQRRVGRLIKEMSVSVSMSVPRHSSSGRPSGSWPFSDFRSSRASIARERSRLHRSSERCSANMNAHEILTPRLTYFLRAQSVSVYLLVGPRSGCIANHRVGLRSHDRLDFISIISSDVFR